MYIGAQTGIGICTGLILGAALSGIGNAIVNVLM